MTTPTGFLKAPLTYQKLQAELSLADHRLPCVGLTALMGQFGPNQILKWSPNATSLYN
jgi:hypothetical protein